MYLTRRQREVFDFILEYLSAMGYAPTFDEIADHFDFSSKGTVYRYIKVLEKKGLIRHKWNRSRAIEIIPEISSDFDSIDIIGLVSAGKPIQAIQNVEKLQVPKTFVKSGRHYVLRVAGESMIEEHILDGDFVVVKEAVLAQAGQTVVALIDNEFATIKRFFSHKNNVELRPANDSLESLFIEPDRVKIQGVVVGVLRRY